MAMETQLLRLRPGQVVLGGQHDNTAPTAGFHSPLRLPRSSLPRQIQPPCSRRLEVRGKQRGLTCRQFEPISAFDFPGCRFGAPFVTWLLTLPMPVTSVVLDEHIFNLRGHSFGVDGVSTSPDDVFLGESPEHSVESYVSLAEHKGPCVEPLGSYLLILEGNAIHVIGEVQKPVRVLHR